jgi:hypothetical protein
MRFHPVRLVIIVAIVAAVAATYLPWLWIGGIGGLKGWNLGIWTEGNSWLTGLGLQDGCATLAIAVSVAPFVVLGDRAARLCRPCRVYVLLAALALTTVIVVEVRRLDQLHTENVAHNYPWAAGDGLGSGLYVLAAAAFVFAAGAAFRSPLKPYVDPAYRL